MPSAGQWLHYLTTSREARATKMSELPMKIETIHHTDIVYKTVLCTIAAGLIFGVAAAPAQDAAKPKNVLFITIDDLRPELASYKTNGIRTPHIDRLASKGLQFNGAYCQYPVCNPSRSSFLTGLRPDDLDIFSNRVALRKKRAQPCDASATVPQQRLFHRWAGKTVSPGNRCGRQKNTFSR